MNAVFLKVREQAGIVQNTVFNYFGASISKYILGECIQGVDVAKNQLWLVKSSGQILSCVQIDSGFTSYRGIYGCKKRGWDLNKINTPEKGRCREAGQIANNTATEGDKTIGSGDVVFCQKLQ